MLAAPLNQNFDEIARVINGNLGDTNLAPNACGQTQLQTNSVSTPKIIDKNVTEPKLGEKAVTVNKTLKVPAFVQALTCDTHQKTNVKDSYVDTSLDQISYKPLYGGFAIVEGRIRLKLAGRSANSLVYLQLNRVAGTGADDIGLGSIWVAESTTDYVDILVYGKIAVSADTQTTYKVQVKMSNSSPVDVTISSGSVINVFHVNT
jgi:hypothetical protein